MKWNSFIEEYRQIKAPDTLRERVSASAAGEPRRARIFPRILAAAAMLILAVTAAILLQPKNAPALDPGAYLVYNGQTVEDPVFVSVPHAVINRVDLEAATGIRLEAHITNSTEISVTEGVLILVDQKEKPVKTGNRLALSEKSDSYVLYWRADFYKVNEASSFVLTLRNEHGSVSYTLTGSDGRLTLCKVSEN